MVRQSSGNVRTKYNYTAFGIQLASDIMLPELRKGTAGSADAQILYGDVPMEIHAPREEDVDYQAAENEFIFRVDRVAAFHVSKGERIVVQPCGKADARDVRLCLLGTAMGVLLLQRGILPIHGSAVVIDAQCIVFAGVSGAGKSTVAAALHKRGYPLLADDIAAVQFNKSGVPWVQSGYPQQKLWQAAAFMIGIDTKPLQQISEDMDKYAVPVYAGFLEHPVPLAAVYEIDVKPGHDMEITPLKGMEKLLSIMNHTYHAELLDGLGLKPVHFQDCADVAGHIPVFRLIRPEGTPSMDKQMDMLERHIRRLLAIKPVAKHAGFL